MLGGKVALITDAACPSGAAIARLFAREGAVLALNYPGGAPWEGEAAFAASARPDDSAQVEALVNGAVERLGRLDILIHNCNHIPRGNLLDCGDDAFLAAMNHDAKSAFLFARAAGRHMKAAQSGSILFVSSIHAEKPVGCAFPYSLGRGAVKMLAKECALDLGQYGVQTNTIEWGPSEGDEAVFTDNAVSNLYKCMTQRIPGKVAGTMEDLAQLALFLTSGRCPYVNGADLRADGGFLLSYIPRYSYEEYEALHREVTV